MSFVYSLEHFYTVVADCLAQAKSLGASDAEAEVSESLGQDVTVRLGDVETIEQKRDKGLSVTVYFGKKRGHASTSDLRPEAVRETVEKAAAIARFTAEDPFAGLPEQALLATEAPDLDLYHPWNLSAEEAIALGKEMEAAAFAVDPRIANSEGASVGTHIGQFAYGNSLGFLRGYPSSRHSVSCAMIAGENDGMQRDYWYSSRRDYRELDSVRQVGERAGQRTVRRLDARKLETQEAAVLFEAPVASSLIGHFVAAVSGGSLYRKASFLMDSLNTQVFSSLVHLEERPHIPRGIASSPFDNEGVATHDRTVVAGGVLNGYFLSTYSARKLGMHSTGNAGGSHNLILADTGLGFDDLLQELGTGLLVTELMGHGINMVTGDYSRGAVGFWVENGVIQYPVEEITIAGNLRDIFAGISGIGSDVMARGAYQCGSILVDRMTIAGH